MAKNKITEFEFDDIEDIRIIIKAKGQHFGIVPKPGKDKEMAKMMRLAMFKMLLEDHAVVNTSLEDLKGGSNG